MRILGIETSCDETAVCLIEASGEGSNFKYEVRGNSLFSQAALHAQYGGVFPNLAKREHGKNLVPLLEDTLRQAGDLHMSQSPTAGAALSPIKELLAREEELFKAFVLHVLRFEKPNIDAIAVTVGPGLEPALWVGINFARSLSLVWDVPLVAVNHMEGHVIMPMMEIRSPSWGKMWEFEWPILALLISGGHTELILSRTFLQYERIGETRDDAAGEAFDKVARLLDLPYPGGPEISRLAKEARSREIVPDFKFTRPMMNSGDYDFSFSGLKTEVRRLVEKTPPAGGPLTDDMKMAIAREFEDTVADVLVEKTLRAADEHGAKTLIIGGGVSANERIRELLMSRVQDEGIVEKLLAPRVELATDNALMIALAGYFHAVKKEYANIDTMTATGNLSLETAL